MIVDVIINTLVYVLGFVLGFLQITFALFPASYSVSIGNGFGYVFGNILQLNSILPVTELLYMVGLALILKGSVFAYKVFIFLTFLMNYVRYTFLRVSI